MRGVHFLCCAHNCTCFSTIKQQGGEVMDDSVIEWWPKVAAAASAADTEQAILDLEGVYAYAYVCVCCAATICT